MGGVFREGLTRSKEASHDSIRLNKLVEEEITRIEKLKSEAVACGAISLRCGLHGLVERCLNGWDIAFALYPTTMSELINVINVSRALRPQGS